MERQQDSRRPRLIYLFVVVSWVLLQEAPAQAAKVTLRADGVILKDNRPIFPIGFFAKSPDQARIMSDLVAISDAGFDTVLVGVFASNNLTSMLDEAAKRGVNMIMEADSRNTSASTLLPIVSLAKSHAATLGYYIMDDAHVYVSPTQLKKKHDDVKAEDPNHLTFMADYDHTAFGPLLGIADVSGPYRYPVYTATSPLQLVDLTYAEAAKCNCSVYAIPQTFAWPGNRVPNPMEERNMVYQSLAQNVKAVIFYAFDGEGYVPDNAPLWNELKALAPELKTMGQIIISGQYQRATTGKANVFAAYWKVGTAYTIVVVNTQTADQTDIAVQLPSDATGELSPVFAGRPKGMTFSGGRLLGAMKGLEVHVYRIGSAPVVDAGTPSAEAGAGGAMASRGGSGGAGAGGLAGSNSVAPGDGGARHENATGGDGSGGQVEAVMGGTSGQGASDDSAVDSEAADGWACALGRRSRDRQSLAALVLLFASVVWRQRRLRGHARWDL